MCKDVFVSRPNNGEAKEKRNDPRSRYGGDMMTFPPGVV
jgi:hypothetical protein